MWLEMSGKEINVLGSGMDSVRHTNDSHAMVLHSVKAIQRAQGRSAKLNEA